ncbi:3-dehydroquinate synthase [Nigerium massiliense]|uniref:3-dehydroquinate synthase n=1 Tax=Nigerium massiliense TaxID=1522317 RepID=UPI00059122B1|nr:3-dehydroquinate synthase [Nigerium massiliense]
MSTIAVHAERPYDVVVGRGVSATLGDHLGAAERVALLHPAVLADRARALAAQLGRRTTLIEVPDAEGAKTAGVLEQCWGRLAEAGFTRSDAVVGLGGGATTDLAGFVAATWLRGVAYVAVPSTVLGMVDAAVGGKTGINVPAGKNLVGAFHEPGAVLCDLDLLDTLPARDLAAGLAEVVKAGFIADPRILDVVEAGPQAVLDPRSDALVEVVDRAIRVKSAVVSADLRETTSVGKDIGREVLNYGHTLGHAIERHERYRWRHGDAVGVGMVFAAELSAALGRLDAAVVARHRDVLASLGLPTTYSSGAWDDLRAAMSLDKKTRGSVLRFVVLDAVADPGIALAPPEDALRDAFARIEG